MQIKKIKNVKKHIRLVVSIIITMLYSQHLYAQHHTIYKNSIASLQVVAGNDWLSPPIAQLNGEPICIAFDDLTHQYHRYTYSIEHCEADWTPSKQLFESDYIEGFATGNTIEEVQKSVNTKILYTHYSLKIPNQQCRIKISGNYRLTIYDDNNNEKILTACFMIVNPLTSININVTPNTDYDIRGRHQQVNMKVEYGALQVTNPHTQIKTIVMQNGYWTNKTFNVAPQYITSKALKWEHNKAFIFNAGNEYRKFETLDVNHPTMGIESVNWDGNNYHAYIWTNEPRPSYVYDADANGAFYIRNSDNVENNTTSEYQIVHFRLVAPRQQTPIYIHAAWTNYQLIPKYQMLYNQKEQCYQATILLKQGYYSYQYVMKDNQNNIVPIATEGNFYQTENKYQAVVYYRGIGARTDKLVGYQQVTFQ